MSKADAIRQQREQQAAERERKRSGTYRKVVLPEPPAEPPVTKPDSPKGKRKR